MVIVRSGVAACSRLGQPIQGVIAVAPGLGLGGVVDGAHVAPQVVAVAQVEQAASLEAPQPQVERVVGVGGGQAVAQRPGGDLAGGVVGGAADVGAGADQGVGPAPGVACQALAW